MGGREKQRRLGAGSDKRSNRGQSGVLAIILLVGITIAGVTLVSVLGFSPIDDSKRGAEVRAAQMGMVELDAKAERVVRQPRSTESITFDQNGGTLTVDESDGRITIRSIDSNGTAVLTNESLGTVTYVNGETRIANQGGAVFRRSGGGTTMVSTPEIEYHDETLSTEFLSVEGDASLDQRLQIRAANQSVRPDLSAIDGPIEDGRALTLTIESEYYTAWAEYFRARTPGAVSVDHSARAVTVQFTAGSPQAEIRGGLVGTAPTSDLRFTGTGSYTDSYNSSEGPYGEEKIYRGGDVRATGNVSTSGNPTIEGDVYSGGTVILNGSTKIKGTVHWTDGFWPNDASYKGDEQINGIETETSITPVVENQVARLAEDNDNANESAIAANTPSIDGSTTLEAGRYYVDAIDLENDDLVLDTTDGNITIGVRDYVRLDGNGGSNITVRGNNSVRLYVASENDVTVSPSGLGQQGVNFHVGQDSHVTVPGDRSSQFWVFGTEDFNTTIAGGGNSRASFTGVIYAPSQNGPGFSYIKHSDVYGAVVSGTHIIGNKATIHYDHALAATRHPVVVDDVPVVRYLNVAHRSVTVTAAD